MGNLDILLFFDWMLWQNSESKKIEELCSKLKDLESHLATLNRRLVFFKFHEDKLRNYSLIHWIGSDPAGYPTVLVNYGRPVVCTPVPRTPPWQDQATPQLSKGLYLISWPVLWNSSKVVELYDQILRETS
ncbi:MAG: hypothetical protein HYX41_00605 [Bdellovibrio sp.]|nr:hypothetical protein [Bdellovibrio sp.]